MTYKFRLLDLCERAPVISLRPIIFMLNRMIVVHNYCVFTFIFLGKIVSFSISKLDLTCLVYWSFFFVQIA